VRFLLDQDVYAFTARFLRALEHDVVTAAEIGCSQATDVALWRIAQDQERLFVTRDRDFGALVFVEDAGKGVIYLRILPATVHACHSAFEEVLRSYSEEELRNASVVVLFSEFAFDLPVPLPEALANVPRAPEAARPRTRAWPR
jgi:predicted nuclease of predicted toxin-antitoxin system